MVWSAKSGAVAGNGVKLWTVRAPSATAVGCGGTGDHGTVAVTSWLAGAQATIEHATDATTAGTQTRKGTRGIALIVVDRYIMLA